MCVCVCKNCHKCGVYLSHQSHKNRTVGVVPAVWCSGECWWEWSHCKRKGAEALGPDTGVLQIYKTHCLCMPIIRLCRLHGENKEIQAFMWPETRADVRQRHVVRIVASCPHTESEHQHSFLWKWYITNIKTHTYSHTHGFVRTLIEIKHSLAPYPNPNH